MKLKHLFSLIFAGTVSLLLAGWALSQVPAVLVKSGIVPGNAAAASGGLVLLEEHTASNSAALQFTASLSASYDDYLIELVGLIPATNDVLLQMQFSTNGGSTWDASTIYDTGYWFLYTSGNNPIFNFSRGEFQFIGDIGNAQPVGVDAELRMKMTASLWTTLRGQMTSWNSATSTMLVANFVYATYRNTTNPNAMQVFFNSGNIASGTVRVYGLMH
jgi:hypothetical protein